MRGIIRLNTVVVDEQLSRLITATHQFERALQGAYLHGTLSGSYVVQGCQEHLLKLKKFTHATQDMLNLSAQTERTISHAGEKLSAQVMWQLGRWLPLVLAAYGPEIIGGLAVVMLIATERKIHPQGIINIWMTQAQKKLFGEGSLISNEAAVAVTAHAVEGADDFVAGVVGLPQPIQDGTFSGVDAVAAGAVGITGLIGAGSLQETPVSVTQLSTSRDKPAGSYRDLISRIPRAEDDAAQIRIEHYRASDTYVVYLGGTIDSSANPTEEPWDMTSNINAIAGREAGSYAATTNAMRQAGITSQDNVVLVGHSQGGLIAAQVAASGNYNVSDVVTVGAPTHHVSMPDSVHLVSIEHDEDIIPSLSGVGTPSSSPRQMTITRSLYEPGQSPRSELIPAHNLSRYIETASLMDRSEDANLINNKNRLTSPLQGECEVTMWRARREGT